MSVQIHSFTCHLYQEEPDVRQAASGDPRGFLASLKGAAILDEIQRVPELLSYVQGLVDEGRGKGRFILTGSHSPSPPPGSILSAGNAVLRTDFASPASWPPL